MRVLSFPKLHFVILLATLLLASVLSACAPLAIPATTSTTTEATDAATTPDAAAAPAGAPAGPPPGGEMGVMPGATTFASVPPTHADLAYADQSEAQKLDIYLPTTGEGPFPVVIMIHGGGFMFGDKADGAGLTGVDQLLEAGYAVASINYRLSGEATWPAQINDSKAAVRFLRAVAGDYNLDRAGGGGLVRPDRLPGDG